MDVHERRKFIAEQVATHGEVEFAKLAEFCDVSEMTIRRDIEILEQAGTLRESWAAQLQSSELRKSLPFNLAPRPQPWRKNTSQRQ